MRRFKIDGMLLATFITTLFYSSTYPYIHKQVMENVSDTLVAVEQIIDCSSIIFFGSLWNKHMDKLFKFYPIYCILETVLTVAMTIWITITGSIVAYYIINLLIFSICTRQIICGGIKLRAMRYDTEEKRVRYDNNNNSVASAATIIGSLIAIVLDLNFITMLWIATVGGCVDNLFYAFLFIKQTKGEKNHG